MLNLAEYKSRATRLADYLPWACLIAPGVVLNKDGSYQRTARYRGPDLDSATEAELVAVTARLNNVLKRFGSGWALFFEASRIPAQSYPQGRFADAVSWLIDEERREAFQAAGAHTESQYFVTFLYLPPQDAATRGENLFYERTTSQTRRVDPKVALSAFLTETDRALDLLAALLPEARWLEDGETLTYLHDCVSVNRMALATPRSPAYLDAVLADTPLTGGVAPKLGDQHLRVLTILGFPSATVPGLLDALNDLNFPYRWMTRWIALDKPEAIRELTKLRRQWFAKRKSVAMILREVMFNNETALLDADAANKAIDADDALQELGADDVAYGYMTATIVVRDADERAAEDKLLAIERVVSARGLTTIRETLNAVEAWLGSLPGNPYANIRQPIVHTLNLAHLMPLSAVWAGPTHNGHLRAPVLMMTRTRGSTPFRFDLHVGDVGHTLVVGPTGSGKSVLLSALALQFRRFIDAQVIVFDKGRSARAACLAMGGEAVDLSLDGGLCLQPLKDIDQPAELAVALDWVTGLLAHEGATITPEAKQTVWTALQSLATAPVTERTLTGLAVLIQSNALSQALTPYTLDGAFGRLLDGADENLSNAPVLHLELEALMEHARLVPPVLTYLFHRLEARFDGRPTLLILDEAWVFLDDSLFAGRIRAWLKTLRKKNVAVVFATQSLADIERSSIASALIESCPTRLFLPNDRAVEPQMRAVYERFGLNDAQIEILARATPKRDYYAQTARGNRLFELGLGPLALSLCGAGSPADQRLIDRVLTEHARAAFALEFFKAKDLGWAADLLMRFGAQGVDPSPLSDAPVRADAPIPSQLASETSDPPPPKPETFDAKLDADLFVKLAPRRVA